jgi:hypothetical protein
MSDHPKLSIAIQAAIGLILLRLVAFFLNWNPQFVDTGFLFFSLAALIPLSIYAIWPRGENKGFLKEVNTSMRLTALFGLIITVFLFLFYQFLETEYFELTREQIINREFKTYESENNGNEMPAADAEKLQDNITEFFSIRNYTAIVLVLFIILSAFYAVLFSVLKKLLVQTKSD